MIRLNDVSKRFGLVRALKGINLHIEEGEFVLLTGPSGAGKSTLVRCMALAEKPDEGEILIAGRNIARLRASSIPYLRRNIGVVYQDYKLIPRLSALANIALVLQLRGVASSEAYQRAAEALARLGLSAKSEQRISGLSGGEQQRVAIARAFVGEPDILIADEPTGHLDAKLSSQVIDLLTQLSESGTTVVVATHDPLVLQYAAASRLIQLDEGELTAEQKGQKVFDPLQSIGVASELKEEAAASPEVSN